MLKVVGSLSESGKQQLSGQWPGIKEKLAGVSLLSGFLSPHFPGEDNCLLHHLGEEQVPPAC